MAIKQHTIILFATFLASVLFDVSSASLYTYRSAARARCEPMKIQACKKLGYNSTRSMNLYLSSSRTVSYGRKFIQLVEKSSCSKHALFFLCSIYSPICFDGYFEPILPCQNICQKVKRGCAGIMKSYDIDWPEELDCSSLPEHNSGVCIQPSNIVAAGKDLSKKPTTKPCPPCQPEKKMRVRFKHFKKADFVLQATVTSRKTTANGRTKIHLNVTRIIKQGRVVLKQGRMKLWSPDKCICPDLHFDIPYYILGYEDSKQRRLLYDEKTLLLPQKDWSSKLEKWVRKCYTVRSCMKGFDWKDQRT